MFDTKDDKSSDDLKMFDTEDGKSSDASTPVATVDSSSDGRMMSEHLSLL
jgi:hypothetical protein